MSRVERVLRARTALAAVAKLEEIEAEITAGGNAAWLVAEALGALAGLHASDLNHWCERIDRAAAAAHEQRKHRKRQRA